MKTVRTSITLSETVLEHIKKNLHEGDTITSFFERAAINQLEKEFDDFEVREQVEAESSNSEV